MYVKTQDDVALITTDCGKNFRKLEYENFAINNVEFHPNDEKYMLADAYNTCGKENSGAECFYNKML